MEEIEILSTKEIANAAKTNFMQELQDSFNEELPDYWDSKTKNKVAKLTNKSNTKKALLTAIPMQCRGPKCVFASTCPLQQEGIAPIGFKCPIELGLVAHLMSDFVEELNVDVENSIELTQIRDMVNQEVQMLRANKLLAQEDFIQENVVGVDSDGDPIFKKELHLAVELEDRLHKRRQTFFKQFLATREARSKAGLAAIDSAQGLANLMNDFKNMDAEHQKLLKKQLGLEDQDDYILSKQQEIDGAKDIS